MADLCEKLGADVRDVARGMGMDRRIGREFLSPGPGFGGSCFPKDTLALTRIAQDAGASARLVEAVVTQNDARKAAMAGRIVAACGGTARGLHIAVLGLTFKPETDDMREAPSLGIVHRLVEEGACVRAYDPAGMDLARPLMPESVRYCCDAAEAVQGADAVVVITEWEEFRSLSPDWLRKAMRGRIVVDLRNIFDPAALRRAGLAYHPIGRPNRLPDEELVERHAPDLGAQLIFAAAAD